MRPKRGRGRTGQAANHATTRMYRGKGGKKPMENLTSKVPKDGQKSLAKGLGRVQQEVRQGVDPYHAHAQL